MIAQKRADFNKMCVAELLSREINLLQKGKHLRKNVEIAADWW